MSFDPTKPANNSPMSSSEVRSQFNGLHSLLSERAREDDCVNRLLMCAENPTAVEGMGMVVSDPPTQAEMQALSNKLDELIAVLKRE